MTFNIREWKRRLAELWPLDRPMEIPPDGFSVNDLPAGDLAVLHLKVMESERTVRAAIADYDNILERSGIKAAVQLDSDGRPADPLIWKRIYLTEYPAATAYKMGISVVRNGWPLSCYSSVPPRIPTPFRDPGPSVEEHELERVLLEGWRQSVDSHAPDARVYHEQARMLESRNLPEGGSTDLEFRIRILREWQEVLASGGPWTTPAVSEPPTTACTSCGEVVPIDDTWSPKADDRPFEQKRCLCQSCFRKEEEAGRAKEVTP